MKWNTTLALKLATTADGVKNLVAQMMITSALTGIVDLLAYPNRRARCAMLSGTIGYDETPMERAHYRQIYVQERTAGESGG